MWVLRTVMLLVLVVWIGGVVFFASVMAPTLFTVLSPPVAANVVSPALSKLHDIGLVAGAVFLTSSLIYNWRKYAQLRLLSSSNVLVVLMMALTAISQFAITPRMRELRSAGLTGGEARAEFDRLHNWSTRAEGGVLLLGLVVVALAARERSN